MKKIQSDFQCCTVCGTCENDSQHWFLNNYFGVSGYLCSTCYSKVSHDPFGKPKHPNQYRAVLVQQQLEHVS